MKKRVYIYDTTLRDGAQAEGIAFSSSGKLKLARKLDQIDFRGRKDQDIGLHDTDVSGAVGGEIGDIGYGLIPPQSANGCMIKIGQVDDQHAAIAVPG